MNNARVAVSEGILNKLRLICSGLPEVYEESAWVGTRWCIRKKNFAHVLMIDAGWPPAYALAAACGGNACILTFRLPLAKVEAPRFNRPPFFLPGWWPDLVGMIIDASADWDEIEKLLTDSYCVLAPKKLISLIDRIEN